MTCRHCIHYREGGRCWKNASGTTSALEPADDKKCFSPKPHETMEEVKLKTCKKCGRILPIESFGKNRFGYMSYCNDCVNKKRRATNAAKEGKEPQRETMKPDPEMPPLVGLSHFTDGELIIELAERGWRGKIHRTDEVELCAKEDA